MSTLSIVIIVGIVMLMLFTIYQGAKVLKEALYFWEEVAKKNEERDRNNEAFYRDFMRG